MFHTSPDFPPPSSREEPPTRSWVDALTESISRMFYAAFTVRCQSCHCSGGVVTEPNARPDDGGALPAVTYRCLSCGERWVEWPFTPDPY